QEKHFPLSAGQEERLNAFSPHSLNRPDIVRFRKRLAERYMKPESRNVLLLLPCSARKPYSKSRTHATINRALSSVRGRDFVHKVVVTSPLGLVPMELELFYPAQHYDIPVTGDWSADERDMLGQALREFLARSKYDAIVVHLGAEEGIVREVLTGLGADAFFTSVDGNAMGHESLENLKNAIEKAVKGSEPPSKRTRLLENMRSLSRFQFGEVGENLLEGAEVKGTYPFLKIIKNGKQVGMLGPERGMISLTLDGAEIIGKQKGFRVEIEDFEPQSTVFAVGVTNADEEFRIGDEVTVMHDGDVRGVGVAVMSPMEMVESKRGIAVRVRHHA
ncbi:MAG: DUF5591 domain-containing protein, partial [Thermoplasmata archaeon]|nr:DUF5591 domain-containing protein [Thermoplasmata archaeon]